MSDPTGLRDNHSRGSAGDFLKATIEQGSELSFVSAYFTVHAYAALKEPLEAADHLRFLFGEPSSVTSLEKDKKQARHFVLGNERQELTLGNQLTQKQVARECAAWIRNKVEIRSITRSGFLHGKLYHIRKNGSDQAILGSSNFTVPGLGLKSSGNNVELNLIVDSKRDVADLRSWFDEIWEDESITSDVRDKVLAELDRLHSDHAPEFIYYLTLFHLFRDYIDGAQDLDDALTAKRFIDHDEAMPTKDYLKLSEALRAARNKIHAGLNVELYEKIVRFTPEAHRRFLIGSSDDDIEAESSLSDADKGRLKGSRKNLRKMVSVDHVEKLRKIKIIDDVLACTERVLNPAAHSGTPPLYEKEVRDALALVRHLENALSP